MKRTLLLFVAIISFTVVFAASAPANAEQMEMLQRRSQFTNGGIAMVVCIGALLVFLVVNNRWQHRLEVKNLQLQRERNVVVAQNKQLAIERDRAEAALQAKTSFLRSMTHEIRTPLNAIVGFSDLLPVVESHEDRMEFIRIIRNNCDMLMRLINDILEASNVGQSLAIKPEEVDFAKVFDDICQTLAQRVDQAGVQFIKDNPYDSFMATLDKGRIQQVLTNFTTNAIKYTHQGHIKLGYREQEDGIYFYCEDTGAGIPKDKQDAVFERFVKLNDYVQGTGLGLSICKAIAERCNGKIGVTSEGEGHGSTFWMWTPRNISERI